MDESHSWIFNIMASGDELKAALLEREKPFDASQHARVVDVPAPIMDGVGWLANLLGDANSPKGATLPLPFMKDLVFLKNNLGPERQRVLDHELRHVEHNVKGYPQEIVDNNEYLRLPDSLFPQQAEPFPAWVAEALANDTTYSHAMEKSLDDNPQYGRKYRASAGMRPKGK
jgi:hypothetical protein